MSDFLMHGNYAILPGAQTIVTIGKNTGNYPKKVNRNPIVKDTKTGEEFAAWGPNNNFPQLIIELLSTNPIIARTLDDKVCMTLGKGIVPATYSWTDGKKVMQYINDPEINDFLEQNSTWNYLNDGLTYLFTLYNVFPKLTKSINGKKILRIDAEDSSFCRKSKQDSKGVSRKVFVNANWPKAKISDKETITYDAIDPDAFSVLKEVEEVGDEFIYPVAYNTLGKTHYQLAHWDAFRQSDWMDVLKLIPKHKKWAMENDISIKLHIELPDYYFTEKFGDVYRKASEEVKFNMRKAELMAWDEFLSSPEAQGKSIASIYKVVNGKDPVPGVKVTAIENKTKDGTLLKDNAEAFSLLLYALGVDPTLLGFNPGEKSSHSGTDKREAFMIFLSKIEPYRHKILEPLNFIAEYNGWKKKHPGMKFVFEDTILTTLDTGKSTAQVLDSGKADK